MRFISYINGCCCLKKVGQQQGLLNLNNEEDTELRIVSITPSVPWTSGQSGVITFNLNVTFGYYPYVLSTNSSDTLYFISSFYNEEEFRMVWKNGDTLSKLHYYLNGNLIECYNILIVGNKMIFENVNSEYYITNVELRKVPRFTLYEYLLPYNLENTYGSIECDLTYYPDLNVYEYLDNNLIKFFRNDTQLYLCCYEQGGSYYIFDYLFDSNNFNNEEYMLNMSENEFPIAEVYTDGSYISISINPWNSSLEDVDKYKIDRIELPE